MMLPMFEYLRKAYPDAAIQFAVGEPIAQLLRLVPGMDRVYGLSLTQSLPIGWRGSFERIRDLYAGYKEQMLDSNADICILPRWGDDLFQGHFLGYLSGAPRRIGFDSKTNANSKSAPRDAMLTESYSGGCALHESVRQCLLLSQAGLIAPVKAEEILGSQIRSLMAVAQATNWSTLAVRLEIHTERPFAIIAPGASQPCRRWPIGRWASVMEDLHERGFDIVLLSGAKDAFVARELQRVATVSSTLLAGVTSLPESVTLLQNAALFIGNDSGPGHIAAALGIPTITLFVSSPDAKPEGASSAQRISPLGPFRVSCQPERCLEPCNGFCTASEAHCILTIEVDQVIDAIEQALSLSNQRLGIRS